MAAVTLETGKFRVFSNRLISFSYWNCVLRTSSARCDVGAGYRRRFMFNSDSLAKFPEETLEEAEPFVFVLSRPVCVCVCFSSPLPVPFTTRCRGFYVRALACFTGCCHFELAYVRTCVRACVCIHACNRVSYAFTQYFRANTQENNGARVITWCLALPEHLPLHALC